MHPMDITQIVMSLYGGSDYCADIRKITETSGHIKSTVLTGIQFCNWIYTRLLYYKILF